MIWHDAINNSVSIHRSNNFNPLSEDKIVAVLKCYRAKISAIVYCQRTRTNGKLEIKAFRIIRRYGKNLRIIVAKTKRKNRMNRKQSALFRQRSLILVKLQEHLAELCRYLADRLGLIVVV